MKTFSKALLIFVAAITLNACTANNGHYMALSNKRISLFDVANPGNQIVAKNVQSKSSRSIFIVVPDDGVPTIEEALNNILTQNNGDYLTNAEITHTAFHLMWAYHYSAWTVKGDVVRLAR